jgi:hypothetical protein
MQSNKNKMGENKKRRKIFKEFYLRHILEKIFSILKNKLHET